MSIISPREHLFTVLKGESPKKGPKSKCKPKQHILWKT